MTVHTLHPAVQAAPVTALSVWVADYHALSGIMAAAIETDFVPAAFRPVAFLPKGERPTPQMMDRARETAIASATIGAKFGMSLGWDDPFQALQNVYVVGGRPGLYAWSMVALVQGAGHEVWTDDVSDARAVVCGRRKGSEQAERVTVTMEQARRAGWTRNQKYASEPQTMLWARAASIVCRRIAQDALKGISRSVEELDDEAHAGDETAGTRTVRRAASAALPAAPSAPQSPRATVAAPSPQPTSAAPAGLPPLPGEEAPAVSGDAPLSERQWRDINATFVTLGVSGPGQNERRLTAIERIAGRRVAKGSELTGDEGTLVLDTLRGLDRRGIADLLAAPAAEAAAQEAHEEEPQAEADAAAPVEVQDPPADGWGDIPQADPDRDGS